MVFFVLELIDIPKLSYKLYKQQIFLNLFASIQPPHSNSHDSTYTKKTYNIMFYIFINTM